MKAYRGSVVITPLIPNLALDGGELSEFISQKAYEYMTAGVLTRITPHITVYWHVRLCSFGRNLATF
jgi:hypothetical protein